ncbi:MAG TPA: hypothetical protein VL754_16735 [Verrucomicrobiae bacterium]|nr:hypothetical protein [Verrucomicrobiae bacterium]
MESHGLLILSCPAVVWGNRWTVGLRCYRCGGAFIVDQVAFDNVNGVSLVAPCPVCGARPFIAAHGAAEPSRLHHLMEITDEPAPDPKPLHVLFLLKPDWFNRLAARALPGSAAKACLQNSIWMEGEYLTRCDGGELAALAALAEASSCPEAIRAMRAAYLAAIAE